MPRLPVPREQRFAVLLKVRDLIDAAVGGGRQLSGARVLRLVLELLGSRCMVSDGPAFFKDYGRSQGYDIPPYAYAGSGDIREVLRDAGVTTVRGWYATVGVADDLCEHLGEGRPVVPINKSYQHRCYPIPPTDDELTDGYALALARHLIDFATSAEPVAPPPGIKAGTVVF